MAVYGRAVMWAGEIYAANYCENLKSFHAESLNHPNWAAWVQQNEWKALALQEARDAQKEDDAALKKELDALKELEANE